MKSIYSLIFISLFTLFIIGCEEESTRVPELQSGASLRISFPDPEFTLLNFNEPEKAKIQFDLFTVNTDIDSANLYMTYFNNEQQQQYDTVLFRTFRQSDFDSEGAIRNVTITPADIANTFGISEDVLGGSDRIDVLTEVVLNDGRRFPNEVRLPNSTIVNVDPNIAQGTNTSFNLGFAAFIACPLPEDFAVGKYKVEQIAGPSDPFFGKPTRWATEEVTLSAPSSISRSFSGTYLTFGGIKFNLQFVCGDLTVPTTGAGLGCGAGLAWRSAAASAYTLESDDEFVVELLDNVNADCGIPADEPLTLRLTKVQ